MYNKITANDIDILRSIVGAQSVLTGEEINPDYGHDELGGIHSMPDGALLFIDAPYYNADQDKFYTCYFSREDHLRLCEAIKSEQHRLKMFITYDNCEDIRELYSFMPYMYDKEWNYCISRTDDQKQHKSLKDGHKGKRDKGKELFILNY